MKTLAMMAAALSLPIAACSGCSTTQVLENAPVIGNICSATEGTLVDEKVVLSAEILYNVPAHAYVTALNKNQLTPEIKAIVKPKLVTLHALLRSVRAAKGSVNCDFNAMKQLSAEVRALLPKESN